MSSQIKHRLKISESDSLKRLDMVAAQLFPQYSRSKLQQWIRGGVLTLNGNAARPKDKVPPGAVLEINVELEDLVDGPEKIPLTIEFEDDDLLVVNKPAGLVVHPGAGNPNGTLLNALLYHAPECRELPRAGIIHRLDKDTSGAMVVARTEPAQTALALSFRAHSLERSYLGIVMGALPFDARAVVSGHARDPNDRRRFAPVARGEGVREAKTHLRVERRLRGATLVRFTLHTGRTHQIRMHARALGHPILGDELYGYRPRNDEIAGVIRNIGRQALHAQMLGFAHPVTGEALRFEAPLPESFTEAFDTLAL